VNSERLNIDPSSERASRGGWVAGVLAVAVQLALSGCTTSYYRRDADNEAYRIVQHVEGQIFGHTNAFNIDTPYSSRRPEEILPAELIEDRLQTNRRVLKLEEALEMAFRNSRRYQTEKERLYLTALTLTGARYEFSPQFFAGAGAAVSRGFVTTTNGVEGEWSGSGSSAIGVSQLLKSGGSLSATLANDILRYYTGDPRHSIVSTISVNLVQPLLRGFGRNNPAVESLTQSQRNVVYAVRNHAFFQDDFALEIVNDYFALLALKDNIRNRYANYLSRVQATLRLEAREDREQQSAVDQARQAELSAKTGYVNAVATYFTTLDQFKIQLGLALGERIFLDDAALGEVQKAGLVPVPLDPDAAYRQAVARQLQILNAIDDFEDRKRKIRVAADRLKAGLDFFGNASLRSEEPADYTNFDPDKIRAGVGLELDLPIDRLRERNDYRAVLVAFEAQLRDLTLTLDTLKDNIERGLRNVETRRQNYLIQQNALELANRRVESNTLLLQAGRGEVRDLIESQDAQVAAQNAVTTALVAYQEARLQLMLDIGALDRSKPQFWLRDHVPGFIPGAVAAAGQPDAEKPLIPPDELFKN
jgi:outer membrane protein TolC